MVDASNSAVGACLTQSHDGSDLPISYASRSFNKSELNKSTIEKELMAIHFAIMHFRPYIYGTHFKIKSDHKPLTFLFALKNPSSRLTRLRLDLEEFDFTVEYIKGKDNVIADALSRLHVSEIKRMCEKPNNIFRVTTRSMNNKNLKNEDKKINLEYFNIPRVVETKNNKKIPKIIFQFKDHGTTLKVFSCKKSVINIFLKSTDKNRFLETILLMLENKANDLKMKSFQISNDDQIFELYNKNDCM